MLLSYSGEKKTDFSIMDMAAVYKNMCVALTKYIVDTVTHHLSWENFMFIKIIFT